MKLLCVGGGSGGHVTPVIAVINEIAKLDPELSVVFVTDKVFEKQARGLIEKAVVPVTVKVIAAGKFRRYMDMALWKQVLHPDIGGRNLVDMFKVAGGVAQSIRLLRREKPDVVFAKGGYVSLPIGYAANLFRIPLVIHDSDVRPGLTNRVLSRWASAIATGTPAKNYRFNSEITHFTGVPINPAFRVFTAKEQVEAKKKLGVSPERPLIAVTGGSLGAKDINNALLEISSQLLGDGYSIYHVTGKEPYQRMIAHRPDSSDYVMKDFMYEGVAELYGAADIIITRASATMLQEAAAVGKPAIIVPNSSLGDQVENAKGYESDGAVKVLTDEQLDADPTLLYVMIKNILSDKVVADGLRQKIAVYARPDAAAAVAKLVWDHKREGRKSK